MQVCVWRGGTAAVSGCLHVCSAMHISGYKPVCEGTVSVLTTWFEKCPSKSSEE